MVKLSLLSAKGNAARYFPHQGFLALTPIHIDGVVRTRLDDDRKPIQASDIFVAVRCYEARIGRTGVSHTNLLVDHRVPLWSKPPEQSWADVGDGDWPFRVVLPAKLAGQSTAHFQEYRVFWRIEAVLNHIPMVGLGHRKVKTFDLPLLRYDKGQPIAAPPASWAIVHSIKLPGSPALRYLVNAPLFPLGPLDLVPVSVKLVCADPHVRVAGFSFAVERRLDFHDHDDKSLTSTTNLVEPHSPKTAKFIVASADASDIPRDENGHYSKTVTLQIPTPKSSSHWAVGETMRTALVTLRFFLHVKVTLTHAHGGPSETLALAPRELCIIATSEAQRRAALADAKPKPQPRAARRPHTSGGVPRKSRTRARQTTSAPGDPGDADGDTRAWEDELARVEARSHWRTVEASPPPHTAPALLSVFPDQPQPTLTAEWEQELERIALTSRRQSVAMLRPRR